MRQILLLKILHIFLRHKDIIYKDKDEPKTESLREDVRDVNSKENVDVFLMRVNMGQEQLVVWDCVGIRTCLECSHLDPP